MKVIIPTYNRALTVVEYIISEGLADLTIIDDCSPDSSALFSEDFVEYCKFNNIVVRKNSVNKGLIGNHASIGKELYDQQLFLINDDDYVSKSDLQKIQRFEEYGGTRFLLSICEKKRSGFRSINYYRKGLASDSRFIRVSSYLFSQHDWLLHGILRGSDLCCFSGFTFFPRSPDMWGRVVTFEALLDGPIKYLPITYQYNGGTSKHYEKERRLTRVFGFLIVRTCELHIRYALAAVRRFHLGCTLIVPFALAISLSSLIPRVFLTVNRWVSKRL